MASNLSVNVTADATQLRAQLALAQADLRAYGSVVRATATEIQSSGAATAAQAMALDVSSAKYNSAKAAVTGLKTALGEGAVATRGMGAAIEVETTAMNQNGVAREAMVLAHELMQGRFSRVGGSAMVMAERMGGASLATMGLVGAFAVAAMGAFHLVEAMMAAAQASRVMQTAFAIFNPNVSGAASAQLVATFQKIPGATHEMATAVIADVARMQGATVPQMDFIARASKQLSDGTTADAAKIAQSMVAAFNQPTTAMPGFLRGIGAGQDVLDKFDATLQNGTAADRRVLLFNQIAEAADRVANRTGTATQEGIEGASLFTQAYERNAEAGYSAAEATRTVAEAESRSTLAGAALAAALQNVSSAEVSTKATGWMQTQEEGLRKLELATMQDGTRRGQTTMQTNETLRAMDAKYWSDILSGTTLSVDQRKEAEDKLVIAQLALEQAKVRVNQAGGKSAYEAAVASFDAQIEAARSNFAQTVALEQQKLAYIRQARGEASHEYQSALKSDDQTLATSINAQLSQIEQSERRKLEIKRADLDEEVSMGQISKAQEMALLQQAVAEQRALELQSLNDMIAMLGEGTNARAAAILKRTALEEQFAATLKKLNAQEVADAAAAAHKIAQDYLSSFSSVEGSFKSAVTGMLTATTTLQKGMASVMQSILGGFVDLGLKLAANWLAKELTMDATTAAHAAVRNAIDAGGSGFGALMTAIVSQWTATEGAKTGATVAGNLVRTTSSLAAAATTAVAAKVGAQAEIMPAAAVAAANTYASVSEIPVVGWIMAPVAAAAAWAATEAFGGGLAQGAWEIPHDMTTRIHAGEMVLPAPFASDMRSAVGAGGFGGGGDTHVHLHGPLIQAIDTQTGAEFLLRNIDKIARGTAAAFRHNPSLRPSY